MEEELKFHIGKTIIDNIEYRKCRLCRQVKVLNEKNFVKRETKNGYRGRCRVCHNKYGRDKQEMTKNELAVSRKYRLKYRKEKPLEQLLKTVKGNAKRVGREFTIKIEDLYELWKIQDGNCFFTNRKMDYELGDKTSVSIDRLDSSIGYIKSNIVLCQSKVNVVKNDLTIEELKTFCQEVLETLNTK